MLKVDRNRRRKITSILQKLFKAEQERKRICIHPGCENPAIKSHILQKNGIINKIAEKNHVMWHESNFMSLTPDRLFEFKKKGINQVFYVQWVL